TPVPEPSLAPAASATPAPPLAAPADPLEEPPASLTPAQRRAIMSLPRRERRAAIAALKQGGELPTQAPATTARVEAPPAAPPPAAPRPARTTVINLEVEASQPSTETRSARCTARC